VGSPMALLTAPIAKERRERLSMISVSGSVNIVNVMASTRAEGSQLH
jgi:hypothetical protein